MQGCEGQEAEIMGHHRGGWLPRGETCAAQFSSLFHEVRVVGQCYSGSSYYLFFFLLLN